jgi:hypothetical protein
MWLEATAWLWVPVGGALGLWMVWNTIVLRGEVRALRRRLAQLEAGTDSETTRIGTRPPAIRQGMRRVAGGGSL